MVVDLIQVALMAGGVVWAACWGVFALVSGTEREARAAGRSVALSAIGVSPILIALFAPEAVQLFVFALLTLGMFGLLSYSAASTGNPGDRDDTPKARFDERDIVFARHRLEPGTTQFKAYYEMRPEKRKVDDHIRKLPGLTSLSARKANPLLFAATQASFDLTDSWRPLVHGPRTSNRYQLPDADMTEFIRQMAHFYGAFTVGVTELEPYHLYSHVGRGTGEWGSPIETDHRYAIAFSVEQDFEMMGGAPEAPATMETAHQYVEAARVGLQLANLIRRMGWSARAHNDGNYRVIAPLVCRDAGLGEIGRLGLLITPQIGPRVRLGVVTTDMPLVPSGRMDGDPVIDFCSICTKCARNCPSRSIPLEDREQIDGAWRWRIDADTCFQYWNVVGTDCGRCVAVCPFSHPSSPTHDVVRWVVARSGGGRRLMLLLDDFLYAKMPDPRPVPDWLPDRESPLTMAAETQVLEEDGRPSRPAGN
jgi:hypothetical protein